MRIQVFEDHADLSFQVAKLILKQIETKPDSVICCAAGATPFSAYNLFTTLAASDHIDLGRWILIGLDEWVGIPPQNPGSCAWFLRTTLIDPMGMSDERYRLFDGMSADLGAQCLEMDAFVANAGGIDLMLVGIGMNGHIGFNEPGVSPELYSHVMVLDEVTGTVGQKYFNEKMTLTKGITLGLRHVLEAKTAVLMASGENKAPILKKALEEETSPGVPAAVIRKHSNGYVFVDRKAASLLKVKE